MSKDVIHELTRNIRERNPSFVAEIMRKFHKVSDLRAITYTDILPYINDYSMYFGRSSEKIDTESLIANSLLNLPKYTNSGVLQPLHEAVACYMVVHNVINLEDRDKVSVWTFEALSGTLRIVFPYANRIIDNINKLTD